MSSEAKGSLGLNYFFNILYHLVAITLPLVTMPYLSRIFGAYTIGRYSFVSSIVTYFVLLATFGTNLYGQRLIARVRHLPKVRTHFFYELFLLRLITTVIAALAYGLLVVPRLGDPLLYAVVGVEILAVALDCSWFMQGMESFGPITFCATLARIAAAVCVFTLVKDRTHLLRYAIIYASCIVLTNLLLLLFLRRRLVRVKRWRPKLSGHVWLSAALFGSSVAIGLYTVLDKTMIGLITKSSMQVGYYEQGQKLVHVIVALVTAMGVVVASRVAALWKAKKEEEMRELLLRSFRLMFALSLPATFGLVLIAPRFVPFFFGNGYAAVSKLLAVLSLLIPIIGMSNVFGIQLFAATGREKKLAISVFAGAGVNVLLNFLLIPRQAALGAAIASVIAELTVTVIQMIFARHDISIKSVLSIGLRYLLISEVMAAVGLALSTALKEWPFALLSVVVVCVLVYLFILMLLRDPVLELFTSRSGEREQREAK